MFFQESSIDDLYKSTVDAFPNTTKRQFATDPIVITKLQWVPYKGVKTLFVKGLAQNRHEGTEYNCLFLFKNVDYDSKEIKITASDFKEYNLNKLSFKETEVLVRCNCKDFYWRFNFTDYLERSLWGRLRSPYTADSSNTNRPPANPKQLPGMCKHLIKLSKTLQEAGLLVI